LPFFFIFYPPNTVEIATADGFDNTIFCCSCPDNIFTDPAVATLNVIVTTLALVAVIEAGSTTLFEESYTVITGYAVFKLCVTVQVVAAENVCWNPLTADNTDPFNDIDPLTLTDPLNVDDPDDINDPEIYVLPLTVNNEFGIVVPTPIFNPLWNIELPVSTVADWYNGI